MQHQCAQDCSVHALSVEDKSYVISTIVLAAARYAAHLCKRGLCTHHWLLSRRRPWEELSLPTGVAPCFMLVMLWCLYLVGLSFKPRNLHSQQFAIDFVALMMKTGDRTEQRGVKKLMQSR